MTLKCIDAALAELDALKRPISVVVKRLPDIPSSVGSREGEKLYGNSAF
jgi:hypothetical protein